MPATDGRFEASLNNVLLALRSNQIMEIHIRKDAFLDQIVVTINGVSREVKMLTTSASARGWESAFF